jgi:hypothetical protein
VPGSGEACTSAGAEEGVTSSEVREVETSARVVSSACEEVDGPSFEGEKAKHTHIIKKRRQSYFKMAGNDYK